jgi:hypothetical protein
MLSCSVAASVAAWTLLSKVLIHPLPVGDPDRLVVVAARRSQRAPTGPSNVVELNHLYPVLSLVRQNRLFGEVAASGALRLPVGVNSVVTQGLVSFVSAGFFNTLRVKLPIGREFTVDEDHRGAPAVAIVSDRVWRQNFGASPAVLGQTVTIAGKAATIVGVLPRGFRGLDLSAEPDIYLPLQVIAEFDPNNWFAEPGRPGSPMSWVRIIGRLEPDMSVDRAAARLKSIGDSGEFGGRAFELVSVNTASLATRFRPDLQRFARLLTIVVGLLLLMASSTVGVLLLVQTEARQKEFYVCLALGASRLRLVTGIMVEGVILSTTAAVLALPLSAWLMNSVRMFQLPGRVAIDSLDLRVAGASFAAVAGAAVMAMATIALVAGVVGVPTATLDRGAHVTKPVQVVVPDSSDELW